MTILTTYSSGEIYEVARLPPLEEAEVGAIFQFQSSGKTVIVEANVGGQARGYIPYDLPVASWIAGELYQAPSTVGPQTGVIPTEYALWDPSNTSSPSATAASGPSGSYLLKDFADEHFRNLLYDIYRDQLAEIALADDQNVTALALNNVSNVGLNVALALHTYSVPQERQDYIELQSTGFKLGLLPDAYNEYLVLFDKPIYLDEIELYFPPPYAYRLEVVRQSKGAYPGYASLYTSTRPNSTPFQVGDVAFSNQAEPGFPIGYYRLTADAAQPWQMVPLDEQRSPVNEYPYSLEITAIRTENPQYGTPAIEGITDKDKESFPRILSTISNKVRARTDTGVLGAGTGDKLYSNVVPSGGSGLTIDEPISGLKFAAQFDASREPNDLLNPSFAHEIRITKFLFRVVEEGQVYLVRNAADNQAGRIGWEGVGLSEGDVVSLRNQNTLGGWRLLETTGRSVVNMDLPPTRFEDQTKGFVARTSSWEMADRRMFKCINASRDNAIWVPESGDSIQGDTNVLGFTERVTSATEGGIYLYPTGTGAGSATAFAINRSKFLMSTLPYGERSALDADETGQPPKLEGVGGRQQIIFGSLASWSPGSMTISGGGNPDRSAANSDRLELRTFDAGIEGTAGAILLAPGGTTGAGGQNGSVIFQLPVPQELGASVTDQGSVVFQFGAESYELPQVKPRPRQSLAYGANQSSLMLGELTLRDVVKLQWDYVNPLFPVEGVHASRTVPDEIANLPEIAGLASGETSNNFYLAEVNEGEWRLANVKRISLGNAGLLWSTVEVSSPIFAWDRSDPKDLHAVDTDGKSTQLTGLDQIVRSSLAPESSAIAPTWELWIQETRRKIRRYTHAFDGTSYYPLIIPVCCGVDGAADRNYLLKTTTVVRSPNLPTLPEGNVAPPWQIWIQETDTTLRLFTWYSREFDKKLLDMPWYTRFDALDNQIEPVYELTKPTPSTAQATTDEVEGQVVREGSPPSLTFSERPTWEIYIEEGVSFLRKYTHFFADGLWRILELPWFIELDPETQQFRQEYFLQKPFAIREYLGESGADVVRAEADFAETDTSTVDMLPWELYIVDSPNILKLYTNYYANGRYRPLAIPWYSTFNAETSQIAHQYELRK